MANNFDSNITKKVARGFLKSANTSRVLTRGVDTQMLQGEFTPRYGETVGFKRPHDFITRRSDDGDMTGETESSLISGKAEGKVQQYFTEFVEWTNREEALEMDELEAMLRPIATRMVTDLELDLGRYMMVNSNLSYGDPDTPVSKWSDVAGAGALADAMGWPRDGDWCYAMGPFTQTALADAQGGLHADDDLVRSAWEDATIRKNFAGFMVKSSNALKSRTASATGGDRVGSVTSANSTYLTHKDTMIQEITVGDFTGSFTVNAGEVVEITGVNRFSLGTRETFTDASGSQVLFRGVVTEDATITTGTGVIKVAGPVINEAGGAYNTADTALSGGEVLTILGTDSTVYQPNLFFHKQAFGLGMVKLPKLHSTDTVAWTEDGFSLRVSKDASTLANKQILRVDMLPAFATFNPFYAGHGYGVAA